jgi:hypothetical protein
MPAHNRPHWDSLLGTRQTDKEDPRVGFTVAGYHTFRRWPRHQYNWRDCGS